MRAQEQEQEADRIAPQTRAGRIELERQRKATELQPEETRGIEHVLEVIEKDRILQRIFGGAAGFRARIGGMITYSGFALGPEYYRNLAHDQVKFRASVRGSTHAFYVMDTELDFPNLADGHAFAGLAAGHRDFPRVDYYGPGPNSQRVRTTYLLEDTAFQATAGLKPIEHVRIGGIVRYLMVNVGPGTHEEFANTDQHFTELTTPGIQHQTNFLQDGGFVQVDWRDSEGAPRSGGNYFAQFARYNDVLRGQYAFDRVDLEVQQYVPFFNKRRVIALRGKIAATDARGGNRVPFYLQPTLGGSEDLRGFRPFRFYDNTAVVLNGEYRWTVFTGFDMALFADAGKVFDSWRQVNFRHAETDAGFGLRFGSNEAVAVRIDTGFSREGFAVWIKFGNVF